MAHRYDIATFNEFIIVFFCVLMWSLYFTQKLLNDVVSEKGIDTQRQKSRTTCMSLQVKEEKSKNFSKTHTHTRTHAYTLIAHEVEPKDI